MSDTSQCRELPDFREMGIPAVRLLQGVLYADDEVTWEVLLSNEVELSDYVARIGLALVIDRGEGLAYLQQLSDDQRPEGYDRLPKLFRRTPLGYDATLLCVLLRDEYRKFEDEDLENERCVVDANNLLEDWRSFFPSEADDVQLRKKMQTALNKLEELKFVTRFASENESWEIRKILKARLPLVELELLRERLLAAEQGKPTC